jgi:hypothetical protein
MIWNEMTIHKRRTKFVQYLPFGLEADIHADFNVDIA